MTPIYLILHIWFPAKIRRFATVGLPASLIGADVLRHELHEGHRVEDLCRDDRVSDQHTVDQPLHPAEATSNLNSFLRCFRYVAWRL